jgi:Holliday junction resolvasome RuvABC endonuclease subunit
MIILGLDPSLTNFGWVLFDTEGEGREAVLNRGRWQTPAKMEFIDRNVFMRDRLEEAILTDDPDFIGIEYPVFNDLWSEGMYGLFLYSCEAIKNQKRNVAFFSPGQVKAHAALYLRRPRGWKMDKPDMVEAAKKAGGGGRWNHNEADAFWVARTAGRFWSLYSGKITEDDLTPPETKQFTEIWKPTKGKRAGQTVKRGIIHRESERFFMWSRQDNG